MYTKPLFNCLRTTIIKAQGTYCDEIALSGPRDVSLDGLVLSFRVRVIKGAEDQLMVTLSSQGHTDLEVLYQGRYLTVRRYDPIAGEYYNYPLQDPLFTIDALETLYRVDIFFSETFLFFDVSLSETEADDASEPYSRKAPVFFGLRDAMGSYLSRAPGAVARIGQAERPRSLKFTGSLSVFAFPYQPFRIYLDSQYSKSTGPEALVLSPEYISPKLPD